MLGLGSPISARAQPPAPTLALDGLFLPLGAGLSAEVQGALAESVQREGVPAGVIRSRRVAIDFALLGERVRGLLGRPEADPDQDQVPLVLNFFDDASVEVLVDAVEPASSETGTWCPDRSRVSRAASFSWCTPTATIGSPPCLGRPPPADGSFRVSTIGGGTYSIEEIDATVPWVDGVLPDEPELTDPPPSPSPDAAAAFSLVDPAVSAASSGVSEIDVLVLYTPAAAAYAGGEASMRADVERAVRGDQHGVQEQRRFRARSWLGAASVVRGESGLGH